MSWDKTAEIATARQVRFVPVVQLNDTVKHALVTSLALVLAEKAKSEPTICRVDLDTTEKVLESILLGAQ